MAGLSSLERSRWEAGLRDGRRRLWRIVVEKIEDLAVSGCYEKVNNIMSFGMVGRLRKKAVELLGRPKTVVDAGCGPGSSSIVIAENNPDATIILLDPSYRMLTIARNRVKRVAPGRVNAVTGIFESIPIADNSVDGLVAMFSFRDAADFREAVREMARILKPGGRLVLLDIYRPWGPGLLLVKAYFRIVVPVAVFIARCPRKLVDYKSFLETIENMLTADEIVGLLKDYFEDLTVKKYAPGLAIFYARKSA